MYYAIVSENGLFFSHFKAVTKDLPNFDVVWLSTKAKLFRSEKSAQKKLSEIENRCFESGKVVVVEIRNNRSGETENGC